MTHADIIEIMKSFLACVPELSEATRKKFLAEAEIRIQIISSEKTDKHPYSKEIYFNILRSEVLKALRDSIDPEEQIYICFPTARKVGDEVDIPNRGKGKILWRQLTERQGLEIGFQMSDGSKFTWEFFD